MTTHEHDVVTDLTAVVSEVCAARERAAARPQADFSWDVEGDVLRDLILHAS